MKFDQYIPSIYKEEESKRYVTNYLERARYAEEMLFKEILRRFLQREPTEHDASRVTKLCRDGQHDKYLLKYDDHWFGKVELMYDEKRSEPGERDLPIGYKFTPGNFNFEGKEV